MSADRGAAADTAVAVVLIRITALCRELEAVVRELDGLLERERLELTPAQYAQLAETLSTVGVAGGELLIRDVGVTSRRESGLDA